jgi:hypothetical protein
MMMNTVRKSINWLIFITTIVYGVYTFWLLLGALFVVGNNDTFVEVLGILAAGLCPVPASLLALRHRRLAALSFAIAAGLWIAGNINGDLYLVQKFGNRAITFGSFPYLLKTSSVPLFLAFFYGLTDLLGWPLLWPRSPHSAKSSRSVDLNAVGGKR